MRDRLIELLDECIEAEFPWDHNGYIADHLLANGVTVQEWISVKDRLPEEGEDVLTHRGSGYGVESLESVSRKCWENDLFSYYHVTHWMPLPPAPEDVK